MDIKISGYSLSILFAVIGFFVYGGADGAIAVLVLAFCLGITSLLLGLIPIAGPVIYFFLGYFYIMPKVLEIAGIEPTWLTLLVFVFDLVMSIIITIIVLIAIVS